MRQTSPWKAKISGFDTDSGSWMNFDRLTSDSQGRFVLNGLGHHVQLQIDLKDHVFIDWGVRRGPDGLRWADAARLARRPAQRTRP